MDGIKQGDKEVVAFKKHLKSCLKKQRSKRYAVTELYDRLGSDRSREEFAGLVGKVLSTSSSFVLDGPDIVLAPKVDATVVDGSGKKKKKSRAKRNSSEAHPPAKTNETSHAEEKSNDVDSEMATKSSKAQKRMKKKVEKKTKRRRDGNENQNELNEGKKMECPYEVSMIDNKAPKKQEADGTSEYKDTNLNRKRKRKRSEKHSNSHDLLSSCNPHPEPNSARFERAKESSMAFQTGPAKESNEETEKEAAYTTITTKKPCGLLPVVWQRRKKRPLPEFRLILAPMVGGSELAYRLLCRRYGADLAYTPMMSSERFAADESYRREVFQTTAEDRPVVAHFSANDPETMLAACRFLRPRDVQVKENGGQGDGEPTDGAAKDRKGQHHWMLGPVDAVDLNLGCPQRIAHAGHFGSYLLGDEDRPTVLRIIRLLAENLEVPVFAKIRLLDIDGAPDIKGSSALVSQLMEAGADLICIHGRYRVNLVGRKGPGARDGPAKLDEIAAVRETIHAEFPEYRNVPIISNGNIRCWEDCVANLHKTGADGVMSAEGILDNPAIFSGRWRTKQWQEVEHSNGEEPGVLTMSQPDPDILERASDKVALCLEYLSLAAKYPVKQSSLVFHCRRILRDELARFQLLDELVTSQNIEEARDIVELVQRYRDTPEGDPAAFPGYDPDKEKRQKEAAARKKREENKRKDFEARMIRKAKREGLSDLNTYLVAPPPSLADIRAVTVMAVQTKIPETAVDSTRGDGTGTTDLQGESKALIRAQMDYWRKHWPQHCFAHHIQDGGCPRERKCAFLHSDATGSTSARYENAPSWLEEKHAQ